MRGIRATSLQHAGGALSPRYSNDMKFTTALPVVGFLGALLPAQEIQSGPKVGMKLTKVNVYAASGPYKGKEFDAAAVLGQGPGALLFAKAFDRETVHIIRGLDGLTADYGLLGFKSFTVWLTDDRTAGEQRIKQTSNAITMRNPMTLSLDGAEGPGNYAINRNATLTLVIVKDGVVKKCLAFTDTGQKDIPVVTAAIESVTGKLPETAEGLMALLPKDTAQLKKMVADLWAENSRLKKQLANARGNRNRNMQRGKQNEGEMRKRRGNQRGGNQRSGNRDADNKAKKPLPGKHPTDPKLMGLIRRSIRVETKEEIDGVFAEIDKAVGGDAEKREAIAQGFIRILGATTYGTDEARARSKAYAEKGHDRKVFDKKAAEAGKKAGDEDNKKRAARRGKRKTDRKDG